MEKDEKKSFEEEYAPNEVGEIPVETATMSEKEDMACRNTLKSAFPNGMLPAAQLHKAVTEEHSFLSMADVITSILTFVFTPPARCQHFYNCWFLDTETFEQMQLLYFLHYTWTVSLYSRTSQQCLAASCWKTYNYNYLH